MKLETSAYKRSNSTYLQGIAAYVSGTPASDLVVGSHIIWNGGAISEVTAVRNISKCYIEIDMLEEDGSHWVRKLKKSRIVARPVDEL